MKILFCAAEVTPLAKVGGLADVVGSLPRALAKLGHQVSVVMPHYGIVDDRGHPCAPVGKPFPVAVGGRRQPVALSRSTLNGDLPVYLVRNKAYFDRRAIYGEADDLERFLLFSRVALALPQRLGWQPDIVHCHDWHTAPVALWAHKQGVPWATVFTIHNLAYQGAFDHAFLARSGLQDDFLAAKQAFPSLPFNILALGILHADAVTTVSQTYAQEILTPEYGAGLDSLLNYRKDWLVGIVNGIDYAEYDPATDTLIAANYDATRLWRKGINKAALQRRAGLPQEETVPLIGMVSRLDEQKGFDLLERAIGPILEQTPVQLVVLGRGREVYHQLMQRLASQYPQRVAAIIAFDNPLAHLVYAGADLFLMPSRFEPCGLGQMIAMRYGAIPIVRRTGGLAETVPELSPDFKIGRGFVFGAYDAQALVSAVKRAVEAFSRKQAWQGAMARIMQADFSWEASARKYAAVYRKAIQGHRREGKAKAARHPRTGRVAS